MSTATMTATGQTLQGLTLLSESQLDDLFLHGTVPAIAEMKGPFEGRVLSGSFFPLNLTALIPLINTPALPWQGKAFTPISADKGRGVNRLALPANLASREMFPFETYISPSLFGKAPCLTLNYDLTENPTWLRLVRDELVKIEPNLYLGRAYYKISDSHKFVLYFALAG